MGMSGDYETAIEEGSTIVESAVPFLEKEFISFSAKYILLMKMEENTMAKLLEKALDFWMGNKLRRR